MAKFCHILMKFSYMKNNWGIRLKTSLWTLNMTTVPPTQAVLSGHKGNTTFWSLDHLFHLENLCVNKLESKREDERDIRSEFTRNVRRIYRGEDRQIRLQKTWISNFVKERVTSAHIYIFYVFKVYFLCSLIQKQWLRIRRPRFLGHNGH